jgi:hypothetical protein
MRRVKWIGVLALLALAGCDCDDDVFVGPSRHHHGDRDRYRYDHGVTTRIDVVPTPGICDPYYRPGPGLPAARPPQGC